MTAVAKQRLLSLDAFRGLTILFMIIVNSNVGQSLYPWISHAVWDGCTVADLVFPFFLFIVGVSLVFSLTTVMSAAHPLRTAFPKIARRTVIIFALGFLLNLIGHKFVITTVRVMGVLQHIALCYGFAACLYLGLRWRARLALCVALLLGYWWLMCFSYVPGYGVGNLTPEGNLAAYLDRAVFTRSHMLAGQGYDPEGLLTVLPALVTTLIGTLVGQWLVGQRTGKQPRVLPMIIVGAVTAMLGWCWGGWFPINKSLWTSSYVLWTAGLAMLLLMGFYWVIDIKNHTHWCKPLEILGVNAIFAYFCHIFFLILQQFILIEQPGGPVNLRVYLTQQLYGWASPPTAALLYALSYALLWFAVLALLYRKKIFIKI